LELLQKHISHYDERALSRLMLEVGLLESAYGNGAYGDTASLLKTARHYRIDPEKAQRAVAQGFAAKQKNKERNAAPDKSAT
jgi:hypothetical protein